MINVIKNLREIQKDEEFTPCLGPSVMIVCAYCETENDTLAPQPCCRKCGAPLREGFRLAGMMNGEMLFVKQSEAR